MRSRHASFFARSGMSRQAAKQKDAKPDEVAVLSANVERYYQLRVEIARRNINEFIELVGVDERTGESLHQAPLHEEFQRMAAKYRRLVLWSSIESAKTSQLAVFRVLWRLGNNPGLRIALVSNTAGQAKKSLRTIQQYIENAVAGKSPLSDVFPNLKPGRTWSEFMMSVDDGTPKKDYSVQAIGVHGNVLGARFDEVVLDDILDFENTRTPHARQELHDWYNATIAGRLTANSFVRFIGTAWHPDDVMHRMAAMPGFYWAKFPAVDSAGMPLWPERWSKERLDEARLSMGSREFSRQLLCEARDEEGARFKREWISQCLARGEGRKMPEYLNFVPPGYQTFTGVDIATGKKKSSTGHRTVLFTIAVHPDESREILCVDSGNYDGPEIIRRIVETHQRYQSIILVEDNAAQDFILQFTRKDFAVPVKPFNTGKNKHDPSFGVESLSVEMENAKWIIPSENGQPLTEGVQRFVEGMLNYTVNSHTADEVMAAWMAREAIRLFVPKASRVQIGRVNFQR